MSRVITVYKHIVTASSSPRTAQESPGSLPVRLTFPPPAACYHNNGSLAGDFTQSSQPCVSVSQPPSHARIEQRLIMPKEIIGTDKMWNIFCECDHLDLTLTRHSSTVPWGFTLSGGKDQGLTVKVFSLKDDALWLLSCKVGCVLHESVADNGGLRTRDFIWKISGDEVRGVKSHHAEYLI